MFCDFFPPVDICCESASIILVFFDVTICTHGFSGQSGSKMDEGTGACVFDPKTMIKHSHKLNEEPCSIRPVTIYYDSLALISVVCAKYTA